MGNCKHLKVKENMFYCTAFDKVIEAGKCKNCLLKIEDNNNNVNDFLEQIFGKGFRV